jgi:hypothetical protein
MVLEHSLWVIVGLVAAVVLIIVSTNLRVDIAEREITASNQEQLIQAVQDCWRREPVQDCYIVDINTSIEEPIAGVPVDWRATEGKVKISREATQVVVAPF